MTTVLFVLFANLAIIFYFVQALLFPSDHINFIYSASITYFLIEFLTIHANAMIFGFSSQTYDSFNSATITKTVPFNIKFFLLLLYGLFSIAIVAISQNLFSILYLVNSIFSKLILNKSVRDPSFNRSMAVWLIFSTLGVIGLSEFVGKTFPLSVEILMAKPANTSGLFVESPQTILVWGIIYVTGSLIIELYHLKKNKRTS